jgi:hypothetical protein
VALARLKKELITAPGGLITQPAGRVVAAALNEHLGYQPGHASPDGMADHRNGDIPDDAHD